MDREGVSMRKLKNEELIRLSVGEFKVADKIPLIVVLDNVRSLNNIGSVFRTADAFLIEAIFLCGITATPPHKDIQKTALGATDSVRWQYFKTTLEAIEALEQDGYTLLAVEQAENSTSLNSFFPVADQKYAVIFGHEVFGVADEIIDRSDLCIEIPQFGTKHSLNIAVSAGIVIWDLFLKLRHSK